jgi:ElaB/YqjD/DUF883 family membrane-anchored ribosome-binding protein
LRRSQRLNVTETPWVAIAVGAALTLVLVSFHARLFGGHPFG